MFKEKSSKKKFNIDTNESYTLDAMHNNMIKNFENSNKQIEYYNNLLIEYDNNLNIVNNKLCENKENQYSILEYVSMQEMNKKLNEGKPYFQISYPKNHIHDFDIFQELNTNQLELALFSKILDAIRTLPIENRKQELFLS